MSEIQGFQFPFYCDKHDFSSTIHTYCPFCKIAALTARIKELEGE